MRLKAALLLTVLARFFVTGVLPNLFQLGGLTVFSVGCFVLAPWLGLVVTGAFLALIGWALEGGK